MLRSVQEPCTESLGNFSSPAHHPTQSRGINAPSLDDSMPPLRGQHDGAVPTISMNLIVKQDSSKKRELDETCEIPLRGKCARTSDDAEEPCTGCGTTTSTRTNLPWTNMKRPPSSHATSPVGSPNTAPLGRTSPPISRLRIPTEIISQFSAENSRVTGPSLVKAIPNAEQSKSPLSGLTTPLSHHSAADQPLTQVTPPIASEQSSGSSCPSHGNSFNNNTNNNNSSSSSSSENKNNRDGDLPSYRISMRQQLRAALLAGEGNYNIASIDEEIETALHNLTVPVRGGSTTKPLTGDQMRSQFRTILYNLKDKKNVRLRQAVCTRTIPPERLVHMGSPELANPEIQQERKEIQSEHVERIKTANHIRGNRTRYFTCGRCKQNDTIFTEMQTSRGDEASTKFVTCLQCNHSWKFR